MTVTAMTIDTKDNVAVVLTPAAEGDRVACGAGELVAIGPVPIYHKIARQDIPKGRPVIKYGECIGVAMADIPAGAHVHVHNVRSVALAAEEEGAG